jgi:1-deoxy-D-xylulose-5-phosphate reductoisomerase
MVTRLATAPRASATAAPRRISILGATGSIGTSTVAVIEGQPADYAVEAVTAYANAGRLAEIARRVGARLAVVADPAGYGALKAALAGTGIAAAAGPAAVIEAAERPADLVVAAIVGAVGLAPTFAALTAGHAVALANKECLVSAGELFMRTAERAGVAVLPVDSEHNALFQILDGRAHAGIERLILTASGGPFRGASLEAMAGATPAEALRHPTWSMGRKISIDSATMMNKGLELIEAHHLFGVPGEQIDVLCHPQSIVHGLVAFTDGSMLAGLGPPDMRTPIAHCLRWPERSAVPLRRLDLAAVGTLTFEAPDPVRFPALRIAREALAAGPVATNILNAANEIAVEAFLAGRIGFLDIAAVTEAAVARAAAMLPAQSPASVAEALEIDAEGRRIATALIAAGGFGRT